MQKLRNNKFSGVQEVDYKKSLVHSGKRIHQNVQQLTTLGIFDSVGRPNEQRLVFVSLGHIPLIVWNGGLERLSDPNYALQSLAITTTRSKLVDIRAPRKSKLLEQRHPSRLRIGRDYVATESTHDENCTARCMNGGDDRTISGTRRPSWNLRTWCAGGSGAEWRLERDLRNLTFWN